MMLAGYVVGLFMGGLCGLVIGAFWMAHSLGVTSLTVSITPSSRNPMEE